MWVLRVLREGGFDVQSPVPIFSDNQSAIKWATGERSPSGRAKHIEVKVHFIRDLVKNMDINIQYVASEDNDADVLTKPLGPRCLGKVMQRLYFGGALEEEC